MDYLFSGVKRILNEDRRGDRIDDKAEEYVRKCREFGVRDWVMMSSEAKEVDRRVRIAMSVDVVSKKMHLGAKDGGSHQLTNRLLRINAPKVVSPYIKQLETLLF